ncbi:MAG: hypothetical protein QXL18_01760 [Candidatus Woesearchaeota archaeon]
MQTKTDDIKNYEYTVTDSTIFIRPMFGANNNFYSDSFYNTYIDTQESAYFVYNLVENKTLKQKNEHNSNIVYLKTHTEFKEEMSNDIFHIMKLSIPKNYIQDYYTFLESKFTKFSSDLKNKFKNFYSNNHVIIKNINEIVYATENRRKELAESLGVDISLINEVGEVRSKISYDKELFFQKDFEKDGIVYEYINAKRLSEITDQQHGTSLV